MFIMALMGGLTRDVVSVVQYNHLMLVGSFGSQCVRYQLWSVEPKNFHRDVEFRLGLSSFKQYK